MLTCWTAISLKPNKNPQVPPPQSQEKKENCSFRKYYLFCFFFFFLDPTSYFILFFWLYKASYFYTSGNTENSGRCLRTEMVVSHHSTIRTRRRSTCKSHLLVYLLKRRRKLMFENDLSLSHEESYHMLENVSRSQTCGCLVFATNQCSWDMEISFFALWSSGLWGGLLVVDLL